MMDSKTLVYNIFNRPKGKASDPGKEINEWEYLNEKEKLKKDQKNVKKEINSFISIVDYKAQIKRGELELNGDSGSITKDFRGLPDNTVDIYNWLSHLATLPKDQVTNIMEQINVANKTGVQTTQTGDKATPPGGQVNQTTIETKSTPGTTDTTNDEGGQQ